MVTRTLLISRKSKESQQRRKKNMMQKRREKSQKTRKLRRRSQKPKRSRRGQVGLHKICGSLGLSPSPPLLPNHSDFMFSIPQYIYIKYIKHNVPRD